MEYKQRGKVKGFTIVELLIVIVVIAILAGIALVAFNGIQTRAKDSSRIAKVTSIAKAIEQYNVEYGYYPRILDGSGYESTCGSQTENWGHCDRNKVLSDLLTPYMKIDPTSLSNVSQGNYFYHYTSQAADNYQSFGLMVYLEGNSGADDGGYYANAFEVGRKPNYCKSKYAGTSANWTSYSSVCVGGN